ncbi:MAG: hypothetical protein HN341_00315 [Verrucomicrobia bacterium]|nr:hypothetical protein [Verrucomicrobiota bacterium]
MGEREIAAWRAYVRSHGEISDEGMDELESHLRDEIDSLRESGLSDEESLIIAVKRFGNASAVAREFSKVQHRKLWKQLLIDPVDPAERKRANREIVLVSFLGLLAAVLSRVPEIFGIALLGGHERFYVRNISFFVVPVVAFYFVWKHRDRPVYGMVYFAIALASAALANIYPLYAAGNYDVLIGIHLPIAIWLATVLLYVGRSWRDADARMDFVRLSGEAAIYLVLICCGGGVLIATAGLLFSAIGVDLEIILTRYVAIGGACAAPVVAVYLAYAKRNIIENMAPVLARIFAPLFFILMAAFLVVMAATGNILEVDRDILIGFDVLLALVLGMLLYTLSARDERKDPGAPDFINVALIVAALAVDVFALVAVVSRIDAYGLSPNKAAALGENLMLLINLGVSTILYVRFLVTREHFKALLVWQTKYLSIIWAWAIVVAFLFPVLFN